MPTSFKSGKKETPLKHRKGDCVSFLEGGIPCEDCDLEGHSPLCGWHHDWHRCDCGELERSGVNETKK